MRGNDIGSYESIGQATMFEGVLANPPVAKMRRLFRKLNEGVNNWEAAIATWTANEMPVKSLYDCTHRLGIGTDVYTFLSPEAVEPIEQWLMRKGLSLPVYWYPDIHALAADLRINRAIKVLYTSSEEDARLLSLRATVVSPNSAWSL